MFGICNQYSDGNSVDSLKEWKTVDERRYPKTRLTCCERGYPVAFAHHTRLPHHHILQHKLVRHRIASITSTGKHHICAGNTDERYFGIDSSKHITGDQLALFNI